MDDHAPARLDERPFARILEQFASGSRLVRVEPFSGVKDGDHSNDTFFFDYQDADGLPRRAALKRYSLTAGRRVNKAQVEFDVLIFLQAGQVPALRPLFVDAPGVFFGAPALVTEYLPGKTLLYPHLPPDRAAWARQLGAVLAQIHCLPVEPLKPALFIAQDEALWFLRKGVMPDYVRADPFGEWVWNAIQDRLPALAPVDPVLVHLDYWHGNLMWQGDRLSAVIDWEEAAYGDPAIDVGYAFMDFFLCGMEHEAGEFLAAYEARMRRKTLNLGFWQLAAAIRPMLIPEGWISSEISRQRFQAFIQDGLNKTI